MSKISFTNHKRLYKEVFATDMGKKVLHDLCRKYRAIGSMNPKMTDAEMRYHEGERNVVLYILHQIEYDIDKYLSERHLYQMEIEHDD